MTIAKVRELSKFGVITDVEGFDIPPSAFSMAVNVRFKKGAVERGPVLRRVPLTLAHSNPRYLQGNSPVSGFDTIFVCYKSGQIGEVASGSETDVSIAAYATNDTEALFTGCHLAGVNYINRNDRVPWYKGPSDSVMHALTNWTSTWRANILRSCNSSLCAFGITISGTVYPSRIKTSQPATYGAVPASWDETNPATNAYDNIIAEMESGITEACALGNQMIVFGLNEAWTMTPTSSTDIWDIQPLFRDAGCISANCVVEVDKVQYVFGLNDIYKHDGVSKKSICDGVTRENIFGTINLTKTAQCSVLYDKARKEIRFNYVSGDRLTAFVGAEGANRCAVYYIPEGTWTFDDLPYVFGNCTANLDTTLTWATATTMWDTTGSSWLDLEDSLKKTVVLLGDANTPHSLSRSLYAVDQMSVGSTISYPVDANATKPSVLEHTGIDLDELPEVEDLEGTKVIDTIWPQAKMDAGSELLFSVGGAENYNDDVTMSAAQSYDGVTYKRCDFNVSGRFLAVTVTQVGYAWFRMSGFDLNVFEQAEM